MTAPDKPAFAWEPLTPRGVAAFAHARFRRLLAVQMIVALIVAAAVVWFLYDACFPTIRAAIQNLPAAGEIRSGQLNWHGDSPKMLAEGRFLAFDVDLNHTGQIQSTADLQIEFGKNSVRIFSLFGYTDFQYPPDQMISFNRAELEPLWGAWSAEILFLAGMAVLIGLPIIWAIFSTIYFLPIWILGFFANRDLDFRASWKFSGAALMAAALLVAAAILFYDFGFLDLIALIFIYGAHFVLGWIYLFISLLFVPRTSRAMPKGNPFVPRN
ncbi:MAG: hypothetical protein ACREFE_19240 [Limisphaerales bacterium]